MKYIGIFGRRNSGKSSIINSLTQQDLAIVSEIPGTTTDPVRKTVEIFGVGPVVIVDTAGIDDDSVLGAKRVDKTLDVVAKIDAAVLVFSESKWGREEDDLMSMMIENELPVIIVHNKSDLFSLNADVRNIVEKKYGINIFEFSAKTSDKRDEFLVLLSKVLPESVHSINTMFDGLIKLNDVVLLVTPIDSEAPTGRMILPQVQAVRAVLDCDAIVVDCKVEQLQQTLAVLNQNPALVVTDSQAFAEVVKIIPKNMPLTSFSILLARQKGFFEKTVAGTKFISNLKDGDRILILESCTHQTSCEDIGRVKLPRLIKKFTGKDLSFDFVSGLSALPQELNKYAMAIQCGGCMATAQQVNRRLAKLIASGVNVSNYGMALAYLNGIFDRATAVSS